MFVNTDEEHPAAGADPESQAEGGPAAARPSIRRFESSATVPKGGRPIEAHTLSDAGAYIAVLAAALGRVSLTVERRDGGKDGTGKGVKIHPFFMWLVAIPLFLV